MKKKILLLSTIATLFTLTSCQGIFPSKEIIFSPNESNAEIYEGYYKPKELRLNYQDVNKTTSWVTSLSTGEQNLLIVPVQLSDGPVWTEAMLTRLHNAFFGSDIAPYYSVKEYFQTSSYGNLNIGGTILDPVTLNYTVAGLNAYSESASEIVASAFNNSNISVPNESQFDLNNDHLYDNTIFIYSNDFTYDGSGAYWAWCTNTVSYGSRNYNVNSYMWASYSFMDTAYDDYFGEEIAMNNPIKYCETHTYIHEAGHLLGLDDYYNYDNDGWEPSTAYDMQANNIGDHNIFSKLALGWVKPYVVTSDCVITLRSSAIYPDCILIKNKWNGSAFDEYLLIEYYTPDILNDFDSQHSYGSITMMKERGLRVYHVDARLISVYNFGNSFIKTGGYTDEIGDGALVGASNTPSRSYLNSHGKDFKLIHLIDNNHQNTYNNRGRSMKKEDILIEENKTITPAYLNDYLYYGNTFNDGEKINFSFTGSNYQDTSCQVTISFN